MYELFQNQPAQRRRTRVRQAFCTSRHSPVASWGTKGKDFLPELKILLCATYGNKEKHTTVDFPVCY